MTPYSLGFLLSFAGAAALFAGGSDRPLLSAARADPDGWNRAHDALYSGRFDEAADRALVLRADAPDDLASYELRTTALLFQVKHLLGDDLHRKKNVKACESCPALLEAFATDTSAAQTQARARLQADPNDIDARFLLGKIDLNHLWLHLGPLGRRTGWSEYREARRSLDDVLETDPTHVRAMVARAWIDYVVDTKMPFGTKWLVGGGSKKRALAAMHKATTLDADHWANAEARFGLWEMLRREGDIDAARDIARELSLDFPANAELQKFLNASTVGSTGAQPASQEETR